MALMLNGLAAPLVSAALGGIALVAGLLASNPYVVGAAAMLALLALVVLVRKAIEAVRASMPRIRAAISDWLATDDAERMQTELKATHEKNRDLIREVKTLKGERQTADRLRETVNIQKQEIASKDRIIAELKELAELAKTHILVSDVITGWLTYASSWPEGIKPDKRTADFFADYFRPGIGRVFPHLRRCGVALIASDNGTYELVCEELAPASVRAVGPQPVRHGLEVCLEKLGISDFVIAKLPDGRSADHAEWLVLFGRAESDPTFDFLVSTGAKVLSLARTAP